MVYALGCHNPDVRGSNLPGSGLKFFSVFFKMDSMNDFILTLIFEFNIKSYINSEITRLGQKFSVK